MDSRKKRRVIIASIVAASLLLVATIGTTAFLLIRQQQRTDDIAEASRVAATFNKKASAYRSAVELTLNTRQLDDAERVKVAFDAAVVKTPKLGDAPAWGETHSASYRKAVKTEKTLKEPYENVSAVLEEAVVGQPFIKAAEKALKVDIDDFVAARALPSGAPIRAKVIPGFKKILATFDKVDVPEGQSAVADKVRAALKEVLKQADQAARNLDSGRSALINARSEYVVAGGAVVTYESSLRSRLESAFEKAAALTSGEPGESTT